MEEQHLPPDIRSEDFEGYIYETLLQVGSGGQANQAGIVLALMRHETDDTLEKRLTALKFIDSEYLNDEEKGEKRVASLEREAECLNSVKDIDDHCL